jgi:predicted RNA binding protein YcfA (HicA-like mRNA interferase family)
MEGRPPADLLVRQRGSHPLLVEEEEQRQHVEVAVPAGIGGKVIVDEAG